jgi:uncharacterized protein
MIKLELDSIRRSIVSGHHVAVFQEDDSEYFLPIWIGPLEGAVLLDEVQGKPNPFTDDLLKSLNEKGKLAYILIKVLANDVYRALAVLDNNGEQEFVYVRPADGFMMALRLKCPVFVTEEVLQKGRVKPPTALQARFNVVKHWIKSHLR